MIQYKNSNGEMMRISMEPKSDILVLPSIDGFTPEEIGEDTFKDCKTITKAIIPEGVTAIRKGAFAGCSYLKEVVLPDSLETIEDNAFENCDIRYICLPKNLKNLTAKAFYPNNKDVYIDVHPDNKYLHKFNGALYNASMTILIYVPKHINKFTIPRTVQYIERRAFAECCKIESIDIPNKVACIGVEAFRGCTRLHNVKFHSDDTMIFDGAFEYCVNLSSINLPANMQHIHPNVFACCYKLGAVVMPDKLKIIHSRAFYDCSTLTKVKIYSNDIEKICQHAFDHCPNTDLEIYKNLDEIDMDTDAIKGDVRSIKFIPIENPETILPDMDAMSSLFEAFTQYIAGLDEDHRKALRDMLDGTCVPEDKVEPIPLTKDILVRNGIEPH